jgi:transcription antitermination factor NusG
MPILAREPDTYPEDLLDQSELGQDPNQVWWALHTLPRREKELMRRLTALRIRFYTPLTPHRSRSSNGRVRTAYIPLFPGYVFLHGDEEGRHTAMTTNCVLRWLPVPDQDTLTHDLRQISRLIKSGAPLDRVDRMVPGTPVEITHGPLAGLEGRIIRRNQHSTLLIEVHFLQRGASVEIEDWMVEPAYCGCGGRS